MVCHTSFIGSSKCSANGFPIVIGSAAAPLIGKQTCTGGKAHWIQSGAWDSMVTVGVTGEVACVQWD